MSRIYSTYQELLEEVHHRARSVTTLGHTVDGSPIVVARSGGDKQPAVFITAGAHATEHAGVSAAVEMIDGLDSEHEVHIIPTRDPVGLQGFAHALSLGLGDVPAFEGFDDVERILRAEGEVLFEEGDLLLSLIGDYGYASAPSHAGSSVSAVALLRPSAAAAPGGAGSARAAARAPCVHDPRPDRRRGHR